MSCYTVWWGSRESTQFSSCVFMCPTHVRKTTHEYIMVNNGAHVLALSDLLNRCVMLTLDGTYSEYSLIHHNLFSKNRVD